MKKIITLFLVTSLFGCSIEEHNRKALAQRSIKIAEFKQNVLNDRPATITRKKLLSVVSILEKDVIIYFTNEDHPAHPSFIKQHFPEKKENSIWTWDSASTRERFTDWFVDFWNEKRSISNENICPMEQPSYKHDQECRLFGLTTDKYYKQYYMDSSFDIINKCRCQKNNSQPQ